MSDLHIFNKMLLFITVINMLEYNGVKIIEAKGFIVGYYLKIVEAFILFL